MFLRKLPDSNCVIMSVNSAVSECDQVAWARERTDATLDCNYFSIYFNLLCYCQFVMILSSIIRSVQWPCVFGMS